MHLAGESNALLGTVLGLCRRGAGDEGDIAPLLRQAGQVVCIPRHHAHCLLHPGNQARLHGILLVLHRSIHTRNRDANSQGQAQAPRSKRPVPRKPGWHRGCPAHFGARSRAAPPPQPAAALSGPLCRHSKLHIKPVTTICLCLRAAPAHTGVAATSDWRITFSGAHVLAAPGGCGARAAAGAGSSRAAAMPSAPLLLSGARASSASRSSLYRPPCDAPPPPDAGPATAT